MDLRPLTTLFFSSFSFKVDVGEKHESYALTHTSVRPLSHANTHAHTNTRLQVKMTIIELYTRTYFYC